MLMAFSKKKNQNEIEQMFGLDADVDEEVRQPRLDQKQKSLIRKIFVGSAAGIVALLLILTVSFFVFTFSGYCRQARITINAFNELNTEEFCKSLSSLNYNGSTYDEFYTAKKAGITKTLDAIRNQGLYSEIGDIKKISFRFLDTQSLKKSEIEELIKYTAPEGGESTVTVKDIDKVKAADMKLLIESEKNGTGYKSVYILENIYFVKENGEWKTLILYPDGLSLYLDTWEFVEK